MEANLGGSLTPIGGNVSNMTATRESTTMHQAGARDGEYAIIMPGGLARGVNSNDEGYALVYYVSALTFKESIANIVYPEVEWASLPTDTHAAGELAARGIVVLRDASSSPFGWNFV